MDKPIKLSIEQEFSLRSFQDQAQHMSQEQAQHFLIKLYEQMILRETMYKHFLKNQWGIELPVIKEDVQPQETMHSIDTIISLPVPEHDRLQKYLEADPHLDQSNIICAALRMWLERRGF